MGSSYLKDIYETPMILKKKPNLESAFAVDFLLVPSTVPDILIQYIYIDQRFLASGPVTNTIHFPSCL